MYLRYWKYAIAWGVLILLYSTQYFNAHTTGSVFANVIEFFYTGLSADEMYIWHIRFRKFMHVFNYAVFSWLLLFGLSFSVHPVKNWNNKRAFGAVIICLIWASIDEFHQSFVKLRAGTFQDVRLDVMGAVFAQIVIGLLHAKQKA